jgi:hypothetical protein
MIMIRHSQLQYQWHRIRVTAAQPLARQDGRWAVCVCREVYLHSTTMPPPLDKNLYTLTIEESKEEPGATDLFDTDGVALYRRRWGDSKEGSYAINIFGQ